MAMLLGLTAQAEALVKALENVPGLRRVGYLDDETQMDASPAKMPAAWVSVDSVEQGEGLLAEVNWAVVLRSKRLAGLKRPAGEVPALNVVESIIATLHGLRLIEGAKPLAFTRAEYMEPVAESAAYLIRFSTEVYLGRAMGRCPNP